MNNIIVGFSKPKKWKPFAWLIMKGYDIPYDHVYIKWSSDNLKRDIIYQASGTKVNFMSPKIFNDENIIIKEFSFVINNRVEVLQFCIDNAGIPYGFKQVFGLAWVRINELLGKKIENPFRDQGNTYVCCELAATILKNFTNMKISEDLDTINPKELFILLSGYSNAI